MGRVQRHAYSLTILPMLGAAAVLGGTGVLSGSIGAYAAAAGVLGLAFLTAFWMGIGRLQDLGRPGWQALLLLVPGYNLYLLVVLCTRDGQRGRNRYGLDPTAT